MAKIVAGTFPPWNDLRKRICGKNDSKKENRFFLIFKEIA